MGEQTFFLMKNQKIKLIQSTLIGSSHHVNPPHLSGRECSAIMQPQNSIFGAFSSEPGVMQFWGPDAGHETPEPNTYDNPLGLQDLPRSE